MGAAAALGGGLQAVGGTMEAYAIASKGQDDQYAAELNAKASDEKMRLTRIQAAEEERRVRILGKKALGDIRTGYAASGVQSTTGSALDVLEESARNAELDALFTKYSGEMRARAYGEEAFRYRVGGKAAADQANLAATGKQLSAASRALSMIPSGGG